MLGKANSQPRGFPFQKYFIPRCVGRGLDLDLRVCPPAAAPAASGNPGFCPLGIKVKKHGFRTAWLITRQKFQGVGLKLKVFILTFRDPFSHVCQTIMRVAEIEILKWESCSRIWDFSKRDFCGNLKHGTRIYFPRSQISKTNYSVHSE